MLAITNCEKRECKYLLGVVQSDGTEKSEIYCCQAFRRGIPFEIAYGGNKHLTPLIDQKNDIVFEAEK